MATDRNTHVARRKVVLSIDLDEWYHSRWVTGSKVSLWKDTRSFFHDYYDRDRPLGELVEPTHKVLALLDAFEIQATFFVLGEVAEYYPRLVKQIHARGHEIACHGLEHFDLFLLSRERFVSGLREAKRRLEDLTGEPVLGYRAPNLIIEPWVIDVLEELGFEYDSSVCPSRSLFGKYEGLAHAPLNPYRLSHGSLTRPGTRNIVELPIPTFPVLKLPAATGIATRVFGKWWTQVALNAALRTGVASYYFHPYELAPVPDLLKRTWRMRVFMRRTGAWMESCLRQLLAGLGATFITGRVAAAERLQQPEEVS